MLKVEQLESRDTPSLLIPGWDGAEQVVYGDVNGDHIVEKIAVAQEGGSAHVVVYDGVTNGLLASFFAFNEDFRGGGKATVVNSDVIVTPGPGGGPRVQIYAIGSNGAVIINDFLLPYPTEFRGGLYVSQGMIANGQGDWHQDAFFLPGEGGGPEFLAINVDTKVTDVAFMFGNSEDRTGLYNFEITGGSVELPDGSGDLGVAIQYGLPAADGSIPTEVWNLRTGLDVTYLY